MEHFWSSGPAVQLIQDVVVLLLEFRRVALNKHSNHKSQQLKVGMTSLALST